jgi:peptide-methionine (S)-S-oxide reductase
MKITLFFAAVLLVIGGMIDSTNGNKQQSSMNQRQESMNDSLQIATFGAGCFWCVEAVFQHLKGIHSVTSGYSGGSVPNPTYKQVCDGTTGHAEAVQVTFDPNEISYEEILEVFWKTHDPTTPNRQGNDVGTQYRSVIFYHTEEQKQLAEHYKKELDAAKIFDAPIVTEIVPYKNFYKAEDYHQNYYNNNPSQPYCMFVVKPKVEKFKKIFKDKLKERPTHMTK